MHGTAQISTELANYKEELENWKLNKIIEENNFIEDTLSAGKNNLSYNGIQKEGNIKTIIPDMKDEYIDELEIIKGELVLNTTNKTKINKVLQDFEGEMVGTIAPISLSIANIAPLKQKENILIVNM